jgi:hypothetical protein
LSAIWSIRPHNASGSGHAERPFWLACGNNQPGGFAGNELAKAEFTPRPAALPYQID